MRIAIASAVLAVCCSITSATTHAQSPSSTCRPQDFSSKKDGGFTIKTLRVGSLQRKITIGPCISDDVAPNPYGISGFQYTVEFTDAGSVVGILSGSGYTLYINFRDGQIEVVGTGVWVS